MRPGSSPWSATPPEGLSALPRTGGQVDRNESGLRPVEARCRRSFLSSCPPRRIPPHRIPAPRIPAQTPACPDFSDMSAVCVPKRPEPRHYSDMSGLSTLQRTDRQERVRFPPRSGLIPAFVPVQLSAPAAHRPPPHTGPAAYRRRLRPAPTSQTCLPYVCRNGQDPATTQTCPGCCRCSGQTDRNESGFRPVRGRCRRSFLSSCPPPGPSTQTCPGCRRRGAHTGSWGAVLPGENRVAPRL